MARRDDGWLLLLLFFLPALVARSADQQTRKRNMANALAVLALVFVIGLIASEFMIRWYRSLQQVNQTKETLTNVSAALLENDKPAIRQWATGHLKDAWDQSVVISTNNDHEVEVVSKGPDKEFGTEDDVSHSVEKPPKLRPESEPEAPKRWKFEFKWRWDKSEAEPEEKGVE